MIEEEEIMDLAEEVLKLIPKAKGVVRSVLKKDEPQETHIKNSVRQNDAKRK